MRKLPLTFLLVFAFYITLHAQQVQTVEVEGQSELRIKPDQAILAVQVQHKAPKASDAAQGLNKQSQEIVELMKKSKLSDYDLKTNNYQVNINRVYTNNTMKENGYIATQTINITIRDLDGDLVKAVDALGQIKDLQYSISYMLSDSLKSSLEKELLTEALKDAQKKADIIKDAMGLQEIKVNKIDYKPQNSFNFPIFRQAAEFSMDASAKAMPVLQPDEQKISDRVVVSYRFVN
ncbi:SIMPL domain-containing protein [Anditalea andensis]|uniref:Periplasmic immunogenic protein n=1 Tax=Anditalea andensis TaxID=1048983 RepID=A0A074LLI4_9BACT|nr:SIMPL domain-containing protein [Anditalea andensis]KEO74707.1 hypothetical protein EL17_03255 [Anditalea andensis]